MQNSSQWDQTCLNHFTPIRHYVNKTAFSFTPLIGRRRFHLTSSCVLWNLHDHSFKRSPLTYVYNVYFLAPKKNDRCPNVTTTSRQNKMAIFDRVCQWFAQTPSCSRPQKLLNLASRRVRLNSTSSSAILTRTRSEISHQPARHDSGIEWFHGSFAYNRNLLKTVTIDSLLLLTLAVLAVKTFVYRLRWCKTGKWNPRTIATSQSIQNE